MISSKCDGSESKIWIGKRMCHLAQNWVQKYAREKGVFFLVHCLKSYGNLMKCFAPF
jgi:hypothetical protein